MGALIVFAGGALAALLIMQSVSRLAKNSCSAAVRAGLLVLWALVAPVHAAPNETQIKAAFLVNFARYIEWPANAAQPLKIGIVQDQRLYDLLQQGLANSPPAGLKLEVVFLKTAAATPAVHMLYLPDASSGLLAQLAKSQVLTVGWSAGFVGQGGMIGLLNDSNRIRFDINRTVIERSGLKVSARLLQLARRVEG